MQLRIEDLKKLLESAAEQGAMRALAHLQPKENLITKNEAMRWLRRIGISIKYIKVWEDAGLISSIRNGKTANSAKYYKKDEIQGVINSTELFTFINN